MITNETPIQELIFVFKEAYKSIDSNVKREMINVFINTLKEYQQKEKAFAFDCFEAGKLYGIDLCLSIEDVVETREPKFDEFYSKYAKQHAD